jgi:hypothetical protein
MGQEETSHLTNSASCCSINKKSTVQQEKQNKECFPEKFDYWQFSE